MASQRLIDRVPTPSPEAKKVKVLFLGMSRTAIKEAMKKPEYKSYHMSEVFWNFRRGHFAYWHEALRAKYQGQGKWYGPTEFEKLLANFDAISDIPCIMFIDELLQTYPDAKVILTNRDIDSWLFSMERSFYTILGWRTWPLLAIFDRPMFHHYYPMLRIVMNQWTHGDFFSRPSLRQGFEDHYAHVRAVVPPERLLEFDIRKDGWKELCGFLGDEIPTRENDDGKREEEPFPNINDGASVVGLHAKLYWWRAGTIAVKMAGGVGAAGVAAGAIWWARRFTR
ncbi:MAG: hypothetical protein Q9160_005997 [Pyrenula sp. 1 TL-2023]